MFYPGSGSDHCSIPDPGSGSRIRGVKKAPDPGSATLNARFKKKVLVKLVHVDQIEIRPLEKKVPILSSRFKKHL
jgi:hypothetical protein